MTITIISRTKRGTETGLKLHRHLPGSTLHAPEKFCAGSEAAPYSGPVKTVLLDAFAGSEALICIMAAGIVVRSLAPALVSKHSDPAVLVLDEGGEFAISLLSGHKGGANELARQVSALLGGTPVLTTASDSQQLPALDLLGRRFGWQLAADSDMTGVIAALVNGEALGVMQDFGDDSWLPQPLPPHNRRRRCSSPPALCRTV